MRKLERVNLRKSEQGVVLVVSLLILLVMTVIGVSSLRTSSLDMRIVANTKEQVTAFHVAETALELAMAEAGEDLSAYETAITSGTDVAGPTIDTGMPGTTATVTIQDQGVNEEAYAKGSSIIFKARRFKLIGTAERTGSHAKDVHQRGFELLVPGS
ncbi:MAG: pilus assembly PilX N-terminal domain-containing protein [Candidatus Sedimenticola sp. (ex Thyasira tokunagai)]